MTKTENEFLREKNETLFKLGRMALQKNKEPELEIIEDNDEDGLDALVNSTVENRKANFRRAGPATYAEKANQQPAKTNTSTENAAKSTKITRKPNSNEQYCHFFSNFGTCNFEQTTGKKCKFSHKKAPVCKYDGGCNRKKCMFTHIKQMTPPGQAFFPPQAPFLPHGFQPPMNPWQAPPSQWTPHTPYQQQQQWQMAGNQGRF